jgi:hypothetical protein
MSEERKVNENSKNEQLEPFRVQDEGQKLTTNQGLKISEDEFSLKAGERGPTLMEDFHFREKMTHFDHERIPERIVHARGFAAHGEFEVYASMKKYTKAKFLQDPSVKTPVFGKDAAYFIKEAYTHFKPIGATHEGKDLLKANDMGKSPGVFIGGKQMKDFAMKFVEALSAHRHWDRQLV